MIHQLGFSSAARNAMAQTFRREMAKFDPTALAEIRPAALEAGLGAQVSGDDQRAIRAACSRAAIRGEFDPQALVQSIDSPATRERALSLLADASTESCSAGEQRWILRPDARRTMLQALSTAELRRLTAREKPHPDDHFGKWFRQAVRGKLPKLRRLDNEQLGALHSALEFAGSALPNMASSEPVRLELARRSLEQAVSSVLTKRVIGRNQQISEVVEFARGPKTGVTSVEPLLLSGMGGSGKSTVLAAAVRKLRRGANPPAIVVLDFDRPIIDADDVSGLTLELVRQLGVEFPAINQELADLRRAALNERSGYGQARGEVQQSAEEADFSASSHHALLEHLRLLVGRHAVLRQQVVLVLDTFEEVFARGERAIKQVFDWLGAIVAEVGMHQVRPIISGRMTPDDADNVTKTTATAVQKFARTIVLQDLAPADAAKLLVASGVAKAHAPALAKVVGGNPLMLRLLATFLKGNREVKPMSLVDDLHMRRGPAEFQFAYLYKRILRHVRDRDVAQLAYPGLVLRRVTPDIIQHVLAEPCKLGRIGPVDAASLFTRLGNHVWLVESRTEGELYHRRDLRTIMLPLVRQEDRARTKRIHREIARYYEQRRDPKLTPQQQAAEAIYHLLLGGFLKRIPAKDVRQVAPSLVSDMDHLPVAARAQVKVAVPNKSRPLTLEEYRALPVAERRPPLEEHVRSLLAAGDASEAHGLIQRVLSRRAQSELDVVLVCDIWRALGEFAKIRRRAVKLLQVIAQQSERLVRIDSDAADHPLWLAVVLASLSGDRRRAAAGRALDQIRVPSPVSHDVLALLRSAQALLCGSGTDTPLGESLGKARTTSAGGRLSGSMVLRHAILTNRSMPLAAYVRLSSMPVFDRAALKTLLREIASKRAELSGIRPAQFVVGARWVLQLDARSRPALRKLESFARLCGKGGIRFWQRSTAGGRGRQALWRGTTPEFRPAILYALRDAFQTEQDLQRLAALAARHLRFRPNEFKPNRFAVAAVRSPERWLRPLVETVDRSGRLASFLAGVTKLKPRHALLRRINWHVVAFERLMRDAPIRSGAKLTAP